MKEPYKPSLNQLNAKIDKLRRNFDYKDGILCVVMFTILTISTIFISANKPQSYIVKVKNKVIGYVNKYEVYQNAINSIKASNANINLDSVSAEKARSTEATSFITSTTIEKAISNELGAQTGSIAIKANGVLLATVASAEDAKKVIKGVIEAYYPQISNGTYTITSSKIVENITTSEVNAGPKDVLSVKDAVKKIISGRGAEKKYTVKDGDTIWDIALSNNLDVEDIQAANPHMNLDKIKIGQVIKLAVNLPLVNVRITASVDTKEQIPFESKNVVDKKMRTGLKKLKIHGQNGLAQIHKNISILNGDVIDENVISNKIVFAPHDEIVLVGGKTPIFAATGIFMKPARGRLTSPFGRRWGRMHEGVDLAAPTGTPIDAADSGKISFVGRKNGYGLCVMINHGNGLQTLYGHTSRTFVKVGQSVKKGQRIASIGSTGRSTGPHLHFEVRKNGNPVNPLRYIK